MGFCTSLSKIFSDHEIAKTNHLIQEEIITSYMHLPHHCLKASKPSICHLSSGGVETPLVVNQKIRKQGCIAVLTTKCVGILVFCLGMEGIYRHCTVIKVVITYAEYMLFEDASRVIEQDLWQ